MNICDICKWKKEKRCIPIAQIKDNCITFIPIDNNEITQLIRKP